MSSNRHNLSNKHIVGPKRFLQILVLYLRRIHVQKRQSGLFPKRPLYYLKHNTRHFEKANLPLSMYNMFLPSQTKDYDLGVRLCSGM